MEKTTSHDPVLLAPQAPLIQRQITAQEAIQMLFNSVNQINAGMQNFHERITQLETLVIAPAGVPETTTNENPST